MLKVLAALTALAVLGVSGFSITTNDRGAAFATMAPAQAQTGAPTPEQVELYFGRWSQALKSLARTANEAQIESVMLGKYRERGFVPLGGSGERDLVYRIDDFYEIRFSLGGDGKLRGNPAVERSRPWLRLPDGSLILIQPGEGAGK